VTLPEPPSWHARRFSGRASGVSGGDPSPGYAYPTGLLAATEVLATSIERVPPVSLTNGNVSTMSSARTPRVSIGLPVFNGQNFVSQAIGSILAQTYNDFELIISDNASTDRTEAICREYAASDRRIRYYRNARNLGAAANFNRTFELASGEYFKWAAHDDMLAPEYLERCVAALDAHPDAVLCQTLVQQIGELGEFLSIFDTRATGADSARPSKRFAASILTFHHAIDVFGVIRAEALAKRPLHLPHAGSDKALLADLALESPFTYVREPLFIHRDHPVRFVHKALKDRDETLVWYGANGSARQVWSWWRHYRALFAIVSRRVAGRRERLRCYGHLLRWLTVDRNFRGLVGDALWAFDPRTVTALRAWSEWWRGDPAVIASRRRISAQPDEARHPRCGTAR
jgi:glycosyltransferase involved in cell wall biosynthesis